MQQYLALLNNRLAEEFLRSKRGAGFGVIVRFAAMRREGLDFGHC